MTLHELAQALELRELTPQLSGDQEIVEGYTSDLLSDILAHAPRDGVLVTVQINPDLVTIAALAGLRAVIFTCGRTPADELVDRAAAEGLSLFESEADSFELVGQLYQSGLHGIRRPRDGWQRPPRGGRRKRVAEPRWRAVPPLPVETGE